MLTLMGGMAACSAPIATGRAAANGPASTASAPRPLSHAPAVRFTGRVERRGPTNGRYAWAGCGFVAAFEGTGLTVDLKDADNQHTVIIDGQIVDRLRTRATDQHYLLARGLVPGRHLLEVYRRTEALFGTTELLGLSVEGGRLLEPPPAADRRLEVLGDSISCGYGNEGADANCKFSAETENHYASYGALLARRFGAELHTVAWSGRGVVKNYGGEPGDPMPLLFERLLPNEPLSQWDFSFQPHAVIVNLGTNDFSTEPDPPEATFVAAYQRLLERLRTKYPGAFLLCTVGPMLAGEDLLKAQGGISEAVRLRHSAGDSRVVAYRMTTPNLSPGCDWHPSTATHGRMAEELAGVIQQALGW